MRWLVWVEATEGFLARPYTMPVGYATLFERPMLAADCSLLPPMLLAGVEKGRAGEAEMSLGLFYAKGDTPID